MRRYHVDLHVMEELVNLTKEAGWLTSVRADPDLHLRSFRHMYSGGVVETHSVY